MSDNITEVTKTSWGKRIMNSFAGIIFGVLLFLASFPTIWWNEGRSVDRIKTLEEGRGIVVAISADSVDAANDGALVHLTGIATNQGTVADELFGVKEDALKVKRTVEMYQWKENSSTTTEKNVGGSETQTTTYSYAKEWSEQLINSTGFKNQTGHNNPSNMAYSSEIFRANEVTVDAFKLSTTFVNQISKYESYTLSIDNLKAMDPDLLEIFRLSGNELVSGNPESPEIGNMRVRFSVTPPSEVSVIGKQNNGSIETYKTNNGSLQLLTMGNVTADAMFESAESANSLMTWAIRIGAFLAMWGGLSRILAPIRVMGDVVPFIGRILGAGIGLVTGIVAAILTLITIALAWVFFRPIIGLVLLGIAALFFFGGFKMISNKLKQIADKSDEDEPSQPAEANT